jgi:hypothetical protein
VCTLCCCCCCAQLLGRADNIKDFIRRGADSGWVETTLSGGPGRRDSVIKCEMLKTAEGYTTRWKINSEWLPEAVGRLVVGLLLPVWMPWLWRTVAVRWARGGLWMLLVWSRMRVSLELPRQWTKRRKFSQC